MQNTYIINDNEYEHESNFELLDKWLTITRNFVLASKYLKIACLSVWAMLILAFFCIIGWTTSMLLPVSIFPLYLMAFWFWRKTMREIPNKDTTPKIPDIIWQELSNQKTGIQNLKFQPVFDQFYGEQDGYRRYSLINALCKTIIYENMKRFHDIAKNFYLIVSILLLIYSSKYDQPDQQEAVVSLLVGSAYVLAITTGFALWYHRLLRINSNLFEKLKEKTPGS